MLAIPRAVPRYKPTDSIGLILQGTVRRAFAWAPLSRALQYIVFLLYYYYNKIILVCWLALQPGLLVNLMFSVAHQCCWHARLLFLGASIFIYVCRYGPSSKNGQIIYSNCWQHLHDSDLLKEEEEEEEFYKLRPANKTDHLCQSWQYCHMFMKFRQSIT